MLFVLAQFKKINFYFLVLVLWDFLAFLSRERFKLFRCCFQASENPDLDSRMKKIKKKNFNFYLFLSILYFFVVVICELLKHLFYINFFLYKQIDFIFYL